MNSCSLCSNEILAGAIQEEEHRFCCFGCQAVYNILAARNQLLEYESNPLYQQALKFGIISSKEETKQAIPVEVVKIYLEVSGLWCSSCADVIRLILMKEEGVLKCNVDFSTDLALIEINPRLISQETVFSHIKSMGYTPHSLDDPAQSVSKTLYLRVIIATFCSLNVMMFAYPIYSTYFDYDQDGYAHTFAWLSFYCSLPVVTYCAWPIYQRFWVSLKTFLFGMETLIVVGIISAFGISSYNLWNNSFEVYFDSMTVIIMFVLIGKLIEAKAKFSAKSALLQLTKALPKRARKFDTKKFVSIKEVNIGDSLLAISGEKIVLDGVVEEGEAFCNEAVITGESHPVSKKIGSQVIAGSILFNGTLKYKVLSNAETSSLRKIIEMIQEDVNHKTLYIRKADTLVLWFIPTVFILALITYFLGGAHPFLNAMSVLLISCPCAIGIAAPLAESYLLNSLAKLGVIVRNRGCLRLLGKEDVYVFDKTGTITTGQFQVLNEIQSLPCKSILKSLCQLSNHPIAKSIGMGIEEAGVDLQNFVEYAGKGLEAIFEGKKYRLGSSSFLKMNGIDSPANEGIHTQIYFAEDKQLLAVITLGDSVKVGVQDFLKNLPVRKVLLSGDGKQTVQAISNICGFDDCKWECTPLAKKDYIDQLRKENKIVCMVGDGINDAPALTGAHIGISMMNAQDISIHVSDILLTTDCFEVITKMRELSIKGQKIIYQNLFWAFFYNLIGIPIAMSGYLSPIFAAFAMVASSLMVLLNARRLFKL